MIGAPEYPAESWRPIVIRLAVATIFGFTIQKLLEETRARALEATRWSQRLESLNEVGNALATETELQPLLNLVAARLRELVGARVVAVLLPAGTSQLRFAAISGTGTEGFLGERVPRAGTMSGQVLGNARSERARRRARQAPVDRDLDGRLAARTSIWVPLVVRDRAIGVIAAHDKVAGAGARFSDDDLRLAETFASRAAVAVDLSERVARDATAVTGGKGTVKSVDKMGKRRLAYVVRKFMDGFYILMTVEGTGEMVHELERRLRVTEPVIKFITVRIDEAQKRIDKIKALRATRVKRPPTPVEAPAAASTGTEAPASV